MSQSETQARLDRLTRYLVLTVTCLLLLLLILTVTVVVLSVAPNADTPPAKDPTASDTLGTSTPTTPEEPDGVTLAATADAGITYQDSLVFVGDSLTAHIASRGVLSGGKATTQVWKTENNMLNLNYQVVTAKIVFPGTGELMTIAEAAAKAKPAVLIITLGTDWGVSYLTETDFKACYTELIQDIKKASPKTTVVLQSIFPVTASCTVLDNTKIDTANKWVKAIAAENGCRYLDTQSILKDERNCLKESYCGSTDGIHLTAAAYVDILTYIRTHAVTD